MPDPAWWNLWMAGGKQPSGGGDVPAGNPNGVQGLADLARGMQHVAQSTQDILGQHFINVLNHYFDPETGEPIEKRITLPNGQVLDIALIALVPPSTLALKRLKIRMSVAVNSVAVKAHRYDPHMQNVDRTAFRVSFAPSDPDNVRRKNGNGKLLDLEMIFEAHDPPEIMHRIQEMFADMVQPQDPDTANRYGRPKNGGTPPAPPAAPPEPQPAPRPTFGIAPGPDVDPNAALTTPDPALDDTQELPPPDDVVSTDDGA